VNTLSDELRNARDSAGPGGSLPPSELPVRLEQLRVQLGVVVLAVTGAGLTPVALFLFWRGPQENLRLCLACLALTAAFGVARAVVPAAGNHLTAAYLLLVFSLGLYAAVAWFGRTPELPPTIHGLVLWAVLATGAVGLRLGLLFTAAGATGLAVGIHQNPGLPPLLPLNFALGLGAACVVVDRLPKELLQQLRRWQEQAAAEIHLHRRLAATLFHDLANPLLVIQLLLTEARTPEDEQRLRAMVRRMRLVLDTALGGPDAPEALDASVLCGELEQLFREKLQRKRLRLRVDGAAGVRLWASAPILRESVLGNLLSNAIKFSAPGAEIELRVAREGGAAVIAVEDRGPGVPSEVRAAVQGRREAPSRPGSEGEPGSGFGLMLAVDYLTAMSGTLEVTDRPGGGTSVRVRLPVASASTR
jgi:signal transduction histidine kinase